MDRSFEWLSPEEKVKRLPISTVRVLDVIRKNWPTNPLEVAEALKDRGKEKSLSAKYLYHFKKLHKLKLIRMKKIGNTYIAWPTEIEELRVMRNILKGV